MISVIVVIVIIQLQASPQHGHHTRNASAIVHTTIFPRAFVAAARDDLPAGANVSWLCLGAGVAFFLAGAAFFAAGWLDNRRRILKHEQAVLIDDHAPQNGGSVGSLFGLWGLLFVFVFIIIIQDNRLIRVALIFETRK